MIGANMTEAKIPQAPRFAAAFAALYNRYAPLEDFIRVVGPLDSLERVRLPSARDDIQADNLLYFTRRQAYSFDTATFPDAEKASNGLLTHLCIDTAHLLAIHILQVVPGDNVLDLSTTSGDTSVVLAQSIWPYVQPDSPTPPLIGAKKGTLHSAEVGLGHHRRLAEALVHYLPTSVISLDQQTRILSGVTNEMSASKFPFGPGGYDKVLVSVPCSEERRVAQAPEHLGRDHLSKENAAPYQRLMIALRAVRIGGRVVYSITSSLKEEHDGIIEKVVAAIEKNVKMGIISWTVEVERLYGQVEQHLANDWVGAKKTAHGWTVLPDHTSGRRWEPLYFCVLTKKLTQRRAH